MFALDIGAHIGYYSWLFDKLVGPYGKVVAFEAFPENFQVLMHNLQAQRAESVFAVQIAVSDFVGEVELHVSPGHSNHSLIPGYTNGEGVISVPTSTVDDYLSTFCQSPVDFIKIDSEGAEIRILSGMVETIKRSPTLTMVVELNPRALSAGGWSPYDLVKKLNDLGFITKEITKDGGLKQPYELPSDETRNILCIQNGLVIN
jgi:FkbM family methyltransferase